MVLQGCASPISKFYYDLTGGHNVLNNPRVIISLKEPKLYNGQNKNLDSQKMVEDGYGMVGYTSYNGPSINRKGIINQAKKVHAAVAILYSTYTNTVSGELPLTLPDTHTSTTSFYGNAYGSGGYANYSGSAYTTSYGTKTTYIPYHVRRSDFFVTYWVKMKAPILGVHIKELTPDQRQEIGSNKGVFITAVTNGSPAFLADIFKGDIILKINRTYVYDFQSLAKPINKYKGEKVKLTLWRKGKVLKKIIKLNP